MKCTECHFENPDGMKFCGECGAKLEKICSECGFSNPPQFKFCGQCCHNLVTGPQAFVQPTPRDLSLDDKLAKIGKYLPTGLAEKILSQRDKIEGERKQVTVMFCDMANFTPLVEKLGPEEAYAMMDRVYEVLIHKVHDYEGTVNELTGDGIMALFGAPIALEDAPQRAIRSSLSIHREITKLTDTIVRRAGTSHIKMRIGINTGPVVVGTLGNDLRVDFKAVGETVNLASRVEGLAEPGSTYVTEDTFKLAEGFFRFEALGEKEVKGKEKPLKVYRVIAPSSQRTRFEVSAERGLTPLVARGRELEVMLYDFEQSKEGNGRALSIAAEAGVGKSRLLYEFRKAVSNEYITFLEGKCLSYGRGMAYHPIIDVLKANFHVQDGDSDREIREKVRRGLEVLGMDEASTLPYFLALLSVRDSGIEKLPISPEARKEKIINALKTIVLKGAEKRHLVIVIEDLHWIDESSEELLKHLLASIPGARVLLIFTYRLEFMPKWSVKSYHTQLNLNRFSERDSHVMLTHILHTQRFEKDLEQLILDQTEGIPLFIEEFVKALLELKIIEKSDGVYHLAKDLDQMIVPSTIQDIIIARVDALPEGARKVLQAGSVIEREFGYELIRRITGMLERDLLSHMSVLKDSELIYERGIFPQSSYIFKHALTRDAVYDSILSDRKKRLHEQIAFTMEELYEESLEQHYGALAEHYAAAENYVNAADYYRLAARKAEKTASMNDAISYARKRVACLEKMPMSDEMQKNIIDARTDLGLYLLRLAFYREARDAIAPIVEKAIKIGYKSVIPKIYSILGTYEYNVKENVAGAFEYLEEAVKTAKDLNDNDSLATASFRLGLSCALMCKFQKGVDCFDQVFRIMKAANILWGTAAAKSYQGLFCYCFWGRLGQAQDCAEEAIHIAEESGDIHSKALASTAAGWFGFEKGELDKAEEKFQNAIDYCEKIQFDIFNAVARIGIAETYYELGQYKKAMEHFTKGAELVEPCGGFRSFRDTLVTGAAMAKVKMGEKDIDLANLYKYVRENKLLFYEGWKPRYLGTALLHVGDLRLSEAEDWVKKAIKADEKNGMMLFLGKDYKLYSDILKRKGDNLQARENLLKAVEIFKECGADERAKKAEQELSNI